MPDETSVGQIALDLTVNQKNFNKQMSGITGIAKKAGGIIAAAFAVKGLKNFASECLKLGSDLSEVQNVVDVTFTRMSDQVNEFAKGAITSFGMSETLAKKMVGTYGAMSKSFGFTEKQAYDMSTSLTALAGDLASFYNMSHSEAETKLKSIFTGETESLKELGVVMTQTALDSYAMANGFGKTTSAMSEAEKVALRYQFVTEKLALASGDFARTSDSWANQTRVLTLQMESLKATIGQGLINLFTPVIKVINIVIGKLITLANAFKAFTELITGKKSNPGNSAAVSEVDTMASGLSGASSAADNLAGSTGNVGKAAKKAAKEMKSLMGFDQISKLSETTEDSSGSSGGAGGSGGIGGGSFDFGSMSTGETQLSKLEKEATKLEKVVKNLCSMFKSGFKIGFGDSKKTIQTIKKDLESIWNVLKGIGKDKGVQKAFMQLASSGATALGKITGSAARIGINAAELLVGGFEKYITSSQGFIKRRIQDVFVAGSGILDTFGELAVTIASVSDVFKGDAGKTIIESVVGVFNNAFITSRTLAIKFIEDITNLVLQPFIQNTEAIKQTIISILTPIATVFNTVYNSLNTIFEQIVQAYDEHVKPLLQSVQEGYTQIMSNGLALFQEYIAPVLTQLSERFSSIWNETLHPILEGIVEAVGSVVDIFRVLWEAVLQPFIMWLQQLLAPVIGTVLSGIGNLFLWLLEVIGTVFKKALETINGALEFIVGVFTGDWDKAWKGAGRIVTVFKDSLLSAFNFIKDNILTPIIGFVRDVFKKDWTESFGEMGQGLNIFFDTIETVFENAKETFNSIVEFIKNIFSGNWREAWQGIVDILSQIFGTVGDIMKGVVNVVISVLNAMIGAVNGAVRAIERAFTFNWGFTNPITGTRHNWNFGLNLPEIGTIPYLADGGFVEKNTPQLAMIGDNRHQGEVVAPEKKLEEMAYNAAMRAGSGITREELESMINRAVSRIVAALASMGFYLDAEQIARATQAAQTAADIRFNNAEVI